MSQWTSRQRSCIERSSVYLRYNMYWTDHHMNLISQRIKISIRCSMSLYWSYFEAHAMCSLHWQRKIYCSIRMMNEKLRQLWIAEFKTAGFSTSLSESWLTKCETTCESQHTLSEMQGQKYRNSTLTTLTSQNPCNQYNIGMAKDLLICMKTSSSVWHTSNNDTAKWSLVISL